MAQSQLRAFSVAIPVEQPIDLPSFDQRVNNVLSDNQVKGFDLVSAVYVAGGSLPPHMRLFYAKQ